MQDEKFGFGLPGRISRRFLQGSVKTGYPFDVGAAVRQLLNGAAAEAVADRGHALGIGLGLLFKNLQPGRSPFPPELLVLSDLLGPFTGLLRVSGLLALAVHIHGKGHISQAGQLFGAPADVVV